MVKLAIVALLLLHGLIHAMGPAKAFGLAELPQLALPISRNWGLVWAACALLFVGAALARLLGAPWWWVLGAPALLASQFVIVAFWSDAKFGTVANVLLIVPVVVGFGSWRFSAHVERDLALLAQGPPAQRAATVQPADLAALPPIVGSWLRRAGVLDRPRDRTIYLTQRGQMQKSPDSAWMPFRAKQWFRVDQPGFVWTVDVSAGYGLSLAGRDRYIHGKGSMRIELLSVIPVADASGPTIDQGTLVRFLAEITWFPSAALQPYLRWETVDAHSARATMRYGDVEGSGLFRFNAEGDVLGFEARRYRDSALQDWVIENDPTSFAELDGIRMPTRSTVAWRDGAGDLWKWLQLEVTSLERDVKLAR